MTALPEARERRLARKGENREAQAVTESEDAASKM
jgi:hypothetical protein